MYASKYIFFMCYIKNDPETLPAPKSLGINPMNALLRKDVTFKWDNDSLKSFKDIKEEITTAPVLISPNYSHDFIIFSFASQDTIVGVLLQKNKDDYEKPIAFMTKTLGMLN
jgi:hypothetical protein